MTVDVRRRSFLFGAVATLIVPPARTFHFLSRPAWDIDIDRAGNLVMTPPDWLSNLGSIYGAVSRMYGETDIELRARIIKAMNPPMTLVLA